jgi:hypothetical protein
VSADNPEAAASVTIGVLGYRARCIGHNRSPGGVRRGSQMKAGNYSLTATSSALTGYAIILVAVGIAVLAIYQSLRA